MPRNHKTILVVEDEKDLADLITYNLQRNGYDSSAPADGQAALEMAAKQPPDLVLLDLMLPGVDGTEVARRLREMRAPPYSDRDADRQGGGDRCGGGVDDRRR